MPAGSVFRHPPKSFLAVTRCDSAIPSAQDGVTRRLCIPLGQRVSMA